MLMDVSQSLTPDDRLKGRQAKIGHKWVRVRDAARAKFSPTNFKRIKRRDWDTIVTQSQLRLGHCNGWLQ